jgi:hypothetical protein
LTGQARIHLGVLVDVSDESITFTSAGREVARWSLDEVAIDHRPDGFHISAAGEEVVLGVTEASRFASELGVTAGKPWRWRRADDSAGLRQRLSQMATTLALLP